MNSFVISKPSSHTEEERKLNFRMASSLFHKYTSANPTFHIFSILHFSQSFINEKAHLKASS